MHLILPLPHIQPAVFIFIYALCFEGIFKITSNGKLLVEKTLNAEKVDVYNLTIEAKDKGSPPRASTVS